LSDAKVLTGLSFGANLGNAPEAVERAVAAVAALPRTTLKGCSSLYRTEPWGGVPQDWFINSAATYTTSLAPADLLAACQAIERAIGRLPTEPKGPRVIDIDIIFYGDVELRTKALTLPHQHFRKRRFVLQPLLEIAPDLCICGEKIVETLNRIVHDPLQVQLIPNTKPIQDQAI
jgi:2-amino-4-hydroxy-6-hydroxymethyldihydropteridine diphosphokinase